jgi:hypothetical protein
LYPQCCGSEAMGEDALGIGPEALQRAGQVVVADGEVLRLAGLILEAQGDLLEAHRRLPVAGRVLQVRQGAVDLPEVRDVMLGLEDGAAPLQKLVAVLAAPQTQEREVVVEAGAGQLQRAGTAPFLDPEHLGIERQGLLPTLGVLCGRVSGVNNVRHVPCRAPLLHGRQQNILLTTMSCRIY